jgi:hypothetical protein
LFSCILLKFQSQVLPSRLCKSIVAKYPPLPPASPAAAPADAICARHEILSRKSTLASAHTQHSDAVIHTSRIIPISKALTRPGLPPPPPPPPSSLFMGPQLRSTWARDLQLFRCQVGAEPSKCSLGKIYTLCFATATAQSRPYANCPRGRSFVHGMDACEHRERVCVCVCTGKV